MFSVSAAAQFILCNRQPLLLTLLIVFAFASPPWLTVNMMLMVLMVLCYVGEIEVAHLA